MVTDSGDESTEKGEFDEAGGSDGETLADNGSGVTSSVEGVSSVSDLSWESAHIGNTTSVVRDGSVSVDGRNMELVCRASLLLTAII